MNSFSQIFSLDQRALRFLRIFTCCAMLYTVIVFWHDSALWVPLHDTFATTRGYFPTNIYPLFARASDSIRITKFLLVLQFFGIIRLVSGKYCKRATLVNLRLRQSFCLVYSDMFAGMEKIVRLLLFRMLWMPRGYDKSWSGLAPNTDTYRISGRPVVCRYLQIVMIYYFAWYRKTLGPRWTTEQLAVYYATGFTTRAKPFAARVWNKIPIHIYKLLNQLTVYVDHRASFLVVIPWKNDYRKYLAALIFLGFHVGIMLILHVDSLSYSCIALWLAILPASFRSWIRRTIRLQTPHVASHNPNLRQYYTTSIIGIMMIFGVFVYNIYVTKPDIYNKNPLHARVKDLPLAVGLQQRWNAFAPNPGTTPWYNSFDIVYQDTTTETFHYQQILRNIDIWYDYYRLLYANSFKKNPKKTEQLLAFICQKYSSSKPVKSIALSVNTTVIEKNYRYGPWTKAILGTRDCGK